MDRIIRAVKMVKEKNLYPDMPVVSGSHRPEVVVNDKKVLLFASNNYLGMLNDPRVIEAAEKGVREWGIGNGGSRLHTGNIDIHQKLEEEIADFKNREAALTFVSGYMVNEGCIPPIVNVLDISMLHMLGIKKNKLDTIVLSDEYNHISVINGITISRAKKEIYRHNDMDDLEARLKKYPKSTRKLIVTEGVYGMEGDIVRLPRLMELAKKHSALVYLDDAHATGILGGQGRGTEDYFSLEGELDFVMGTFTKAFGGVGGYIAGSKDVIEYLKISARSFIFTAPIAPPVVCGLREAIRIVKDETWRRARLLQNARHLRDGLKNLGFDTMASETQIIPVLIGDEKKAIRLSRSLFDKGVFVPVIRWPAVPKGMARLRFSVMAAHEKDHIDRLLDHMKREKELL